MRSLLLLIASCATLAASSAAVAGEHYVEVWNPPEARAFRPRAHLSGHLAKRPRKPFKAAAKPGQATHSPTHVAKALTPSHVLAAPSGKRVDIPPVIGPDGQVLWVRNEMGSRFAAYTPAGRAERMLSASA